MEAVCSEVEPSIAALSSELGEPQSLEEAVTFIDASTPLNAEYSDAIVDVGLSDQRRAEIEQVHDLLEQQSSLVDDLREAAVNGEKKRSWQPLNDSKNDPTRWMGQHVKVPCVS